ncbi:MAG: hypothetical protein ACOVQX_01140 [Legionella sp.]
MVVSSVAIGEEHQVQLSTMCVCWLIDDEVHETNVEAARGEQRFKNWSRLWTLNLIENLNPEWRALYEEICC